MRQIKLVFVTGMLVFSASILVSGWSLAGEEPARGPVPFETFDKDGSGYISEEEFNSVRGERMAAMAAAGRKMKGAASAPGFEDIDTDNDGKLSAGELSAAQKSHRAKMAGGKHQHGAGEGSGKGAGHKAGKHGKKCHCDCDCKGKGAGKGKKKGNMPMFKDFDLNSDGKIVEDEFNQVHAKKMAEMAAQGRQMKHAGEAPGFSGIDSNGDGEISKEEFSAHKAQHRKARQKQGI